MAKLILGKDIRAAGFEQAEEHSLKPCPKCDREVMLFAGGGMYDYVINCDCGYTFEASSLKKIVRDWQTLSRPTVLSAALAWRKFSVDMEDMQEAESGCKCTVCKLIRAIDKHIASEERKLKDN